MSDQEESGLQAEVTAKKAKGQTEDTLTTTPPGSQHNDKLTGEQLSRRSYHAILNRLHKCRRRVLDAMLRLGRPATANMISECLGANKRLDCVNARTRLLELARQGFVIIDHVAEDPTTNMKVRWYRVAQPGEQEVQALPKRVSREVLEIENNMFREELAKLDDLVRQWERFWERNKPQADGRNVQKSGTP